MPTCGYCGEESAPAAKFCAECGRRIEPTAGTRHRALKTVSIVFSDLVDSTSLGEELEAESLREVLDDYFEAM